MAEACVCTICQTSIFDGRPYLTTGCKHTFHIECIAKNATTNNNHCPNCRQKIPCFREVFTVYDNTEKKTENKTVLDEEEEDGWNCSSCTYRNSINNNICQICEQGIRVQAEKQLKSNVNSQNNLIPMKPNIKNKCNDPDCHTRNKSSRSLCNACTEEEFLSDSTGKISNDVIEKNRDKPLPSVLPLYPSLPSSIADLHQTKWRCKLCNYDQNFDNNDKCNYCGDSHRSQLRKLSVIDNSGQINNPQNDDPSNKQGLPRKNSRSNSSVLSTNKEDMRQIVATVGQKAVRHKDTSSAIVYIPDLPADKKSAELEQAIRKRLEDAHRIQVTQVECFSHLGIGIVHLVNQEDKQILVHTIQSFLLFPDNNIKVTCIDQLHVTSYLVFNKNLPLPTNNAIRKRWKEVFSSSIQPRFETVSAQFPNILKMILFSSEELQAIAKHGVLHFEEEEQVARFYTHVGCSYFEDLRHSSIELDENRIFCYIATQLNMSIQAQKNPNRCEEQANILYQQIQTLPQPIKQLKLQLYIQYDKQSSTAIVLASNLLYKWLSMSFLNIDGQIVWKTSNISYKVIIKPIPHNFPLHLIYHHHILNQFIDPDSTQLNGENLITGIKTKNGYDECLNMKVCQVIHNGDRVTLHILPYTIVEDPDNSEINIENWYGTQMQKYKPDITQFDAHHPIFRYQWNSKIWLDQFRQNKQEVEHINDPDKRRQNEFIRRMLRVTVMLNTMTTMRKRKYIIEDSSSKTEVLIEPSSPLITTRYDHQSKFTRTIQKIKIPFDSTSVRVVNEDCLLSYHSLVFSGMKPLLLNMANPTEPGGGYRRGAGAQEENLFRRSDYYISLDYVMDQKHNKSYGAIREYCAFTGETERLTADQPLYPMAEYGALYTSGITVFRGTEDQGYPYLTQPQYNVCAIAIAAYRNPSMQKDKPRLTPKMAAQTRKKIETLFAVAYKNGHDSLVLSAFGCGAFTNPPEHIALIFKSVILQYAGFFKEVVFAIIDDHNTGGRLNPNGNLLPFQRVLDRFIAHPPVTQKTYMSLGPYKLSLSPENDKNTIIEGYSVGNLNPCQYGGYCNNIADRKHCQSYSHPPLCPFNSECPKDKDDVHYHMFVHRKQCSDKGQCVLTDSSHLTYFDHPEYCPEGGHCINIKLDHLYLYRHVPICEQGINCPRKVKQISTHLAEYRHCQHPCKFGGSCVHYHDQKHMADEYHPFKQPCPHTPFSCQMYVTFLQTDNNKSNSDKHGNELNEIEKHCYSYSHVCPWGRQCTNQTEQHLSITIHIFRRMCPSKQNCNEIMKEDHLDSFSHPNIPDIRYLCRQSAAECPNQSHIEHIRKYRHTYTLDHVGVAQYYALNKQINFVANQIHMTSMIRQYVENTYKKQWKKVIVEKNILEWIAALQPVHRCVGPIFESILVHGHVMSRSHMEKLKKPTFVSETILQHKRIRKILANQGPALQADAKEFINALVREEFKTKYKIIERDDTNSESLKYVLHSKIQTLKVILADADLDEIRRCTSQIVQASINLHDNIPGIGFKGDLIYGTNQHIFSILGPNTAPYYGDIVIVFKRDIMLHPDVNITMQAATMFSGNTYLCRPWVNDASSEAGHIKEFNSTKLHCSIPGYDSSIALELMAITGLRKKTMDITLDKIIDRWIQIDAHQVIEAHLPQLIPLSYIDHIYMPLNVFESLSSDARKTARILFPHNLTLTNHIVDLTIDQRAFRGPDPSRVEYHNYVIHETLQLIEKQQKRNANLSTSQLLTSYGMTITVPATNFKSFATHPLTITQSYLQSGKSSQPVGSIYIYWKALHGDFMLVLTNEIIKPGEIQSNLIYLTCYIAPFAKNDNDNDTYVEHYTYIDRYAPLAHHTVVEQKKFKAGSNIFHKGCNPDDYNLYCLEINSRTNQVILKNAGVNGIYNHTVLNCTFDRNELDLHSLNYINVTAGNQNISIRNLIITHEMISQAHPTYSTQDLLDISKRNPSRTLKTERDSEGNSSMSEETDDDNPAPSSRSFKPFKWLKKKILTKKENQLKADDNQSEEDEDNNCLSSCKDSIYCLDQYSREKSLNHNRKYSHPCRFFELCRDVDQMPHSIQFTHEKHDVPKCEQDTVCKKVIDPFHRYSYRHTDLSDLLCPCRNQQQCSDFSFEHRKKFFHGEHIKSFLTKRKSKDIKKPKIAYLARLNRPQRTKSEEDLGSNKLENTLNKKVPSVAILNINDSDEELQSYF